MLTAWEIFFICVGAALGILLLFMITRTMLLKKEKKEEIDFKPLKVDVEDIARKLSEAVRIPTVTVISHEQSFEPFFAFQSFLEKNFPYTFARAEKKLINNYSLLLKIEGSDKSLLPGAFLGHQDVVPAPPEGWDYEPFGGEIADGYIYGRGSQDMKSHLITNLQGLESLLEQGKEPKRTIYFCFGHDEEYTGKDGAKYIAQYLYDNDIKLEFVFDEGGTILDGKAFGIEEKLALIGTCEKGYVDYTLTSDKQGGHASSPLKKSAVDEVCEAVYLLRSIPMKAYFSKPMKDFFKTIAPSMKPFYKFIFANRDIFSPLLKVLLSKAHPAAASCLRTTFAFTQIKGSDAPNVIPPSATAVINCRINIGQTQENVVKHIKKVVGKDIKIGQLTDGFNPSPVSNIESSAYKTLTRTITEIFPGYIPAPQPFIAATDAKYYYKVCENVFRISPFEITPDDQKRIHANNERCEIKFLEKAAQFFARLIENTCF